MRKMVMRGGDGSTVRGQWLTRDGVVTVKSSYGQQKTDQPPWINATRACQTVAVGNGRKSARSSATDTERKRGSKEKRQERHRREPL